MKKILVIGAGMGGLSAAIKLQHAGYEVEIFEKLDKPGGKMNQLTFSGFTFDTGPSLVMMPDIFREVYTNVGKDPNDYIELLPLDPAISVYYEDDMSEKIDVSSDFSKLIPTLEKISVRDTEGFLNYLKSIYGRYNIAKEHFILKSFNKKSDFYNANTILQALRLRTFNNASASINKYVKNKYIAQMLSFQTLYIGVSPYNGPSLYTIIPMIELLYGVFYLKGGMHSMAKGMARVFEELGGKIHYNTPVDEITMAESKVQGVRIKEQTYEADFVITNADFPYAVKNLVKDEKVKGKYTDAKINRLKYSCSCLVFYLGTKRKYSDISVHNFVIADDLDRNLHEIFEGDKIKDPSFYVYSASQIDETMAPEGKDGLYILIPVSELSISKYEWNQETVDYYRETVLTKLAKHPSFGTIFTDIEVERVFTPKEFEGQFNAYNGACFGLQPILKQSNHLRPQSKALNCEGLYFSGSSTHPGAGVPITISSGLLAANSLLEDEGKN
ncbi:phytoene desaturase family protein [Candidatus Enterococcus huntleyi]|uniref:phytoene desaturase family protein n=1 Tax=Candidatus Enterococcus huntleyi TaxID=1857217 RepID=UPI00192A6152|nr:phytoene desaturase family protein [Enterococcus sp. JM4C]